MNDPVELTMAGVARKTYAWTHGFHFSIFVDYEDASGGSTGRFSHADCSNKCHTRIAE